MNSLIDQIQKSNTWQEIHAQPDIWRAWSNDFSAEAYKSWIAQLGIKEVWFCGAGTSAYIGDIIAAGLPNAGGIRFRSVPSTDLVARAGYYLNNPPNDLLIVNFGRSGNSSETLGTLSAIEVLAPSLPTLNITCNSESALAKSTLGRSILLPDACHDAGFAMTSSFSTMLLTALSIFDTGADARYNIRRLAEHAEAVLPVFASQILRSEVPSRAVFVGSGPMAFAARESALKVMELTAGKIPALWDSTLGFRHGPKSFISSGTAIYVLHSAGYPATKYEADLVEELRIQFPEATTMTIGEDANFSTKSIGSSVWDSVLSVMPAQLASVVWSDRLGLRVDDPFVGQSTLTRVVSGVQLHPLEPVQ